MVGDVNSVTKKY